MNDWISETLYSNGVLKNKLHIHDPKELEKKEYELSARNALFLLQKKPQINDIGDLKKVHQFLFGELYDWAGKYRPGNFNKNGYEFFDHTRFDFAEKDINNMLHKHPAGKPLANKDYAELLDAINFMHPFREGNGRSCKVFLSAYAANHGQVIDYPRRNKEMIEAQNEANVDKIAKLIKVENTPSRNRAFQVLASQQSAGKTLSQAELAQKYAEQQNKEQQEFDQDEGLELE